MPPIHENIGDCAISAACRRAAQSVGQEAGELIFVHLPDAHGEVAVTDAPGPADMAVDWNVVRRIRTDQVDDFMIKKHRIGGGPACIAAKELVPAEQPKVARLRNSGPFVPIGRDRVFDRGVRAIRCALPGLVQNDVDLG
jgi:hypothetical protein